MGLSSQEEIIQNILLQTLSIFNCLTEKFQIYKKYIG